MSEKQEPYYSDSGKQLSPNPFGPIYDMRLLTEKEAVAFAAQIASILPEFRVIWVAGIKDDTGIVHLSLEDGNPDECLLLDTLSSVTGFLNFLAMQKKLEGKRD